jgi:uncharacterized protein with FMN-binding domain
VSGATKSSNGVINAVKAALATDASVGETSTYPSKEDVVAPFRDGVYTGKADGYKENLNVKVTIKDNKIIKIDLGDNNETPRYFSKVWPLIPDQMIAKQSADVDAVSGATRSTNGIMNAVKDALRNSKLALSAPAEAPYKDGSYEGEANGLRGPVKVNVTVKDNKILKVDMISNVDDKDWFDKAWPTIPEKIVETNNANVDVVSGATYSSKGIIGAVNDALRKSHDSTLNLGDTTSNISEGSKDNTTASNNSNNSTDDNNAGNNTSSNSSNGTNSSTNNSNQSSNNSTANSANQTGSGSTSSDNSASTGTASGSNSTSTENTKTKPVDNTSSGNTTATDSNTGTSQNSNSTTNSSEVKYKDGVYTGTGDGFEPNLKLSVTVKDGKITDIKTISNNETESFYNNAFNTVSKEIISKQSTEVDSVSGATFSSKGIMAAVKDALKNAKA